MLTQGQANKIIHRWMGKCWHEFETNGFAWFCKKCRVAFSTVEDFPERNYFSEWGWFQIKEELTENADHEDLLTFFELTIHVDTAILDYRFTNPDSLPWKLVDWVRSEEGE